MVGRPRLRRRLARRSRSAYAGRTPTAGGGHGTPLDGAGRPLGDRVTGFSIGADPVEIARGNDLAVDAWDAAGRDQRPRLVSGSFYLLGGAHADAELKRFARAYLAVFGDRAADALSQLVGLSSPGRLLDALAAAESAGCDEFILVPGTVDPDCLERTSAALSG